MVEQSDTHHVGRDASPDWPHPSLHHMIRAAAMFGNVSPAGQQHFDDVRTPANLSKVLSSLIHVVVDTLPTSS
jgi:hypothetical protein